MCSFEQGLRRGKLIRQLPDSHLKIIVEVASETRRLRAAVHHYDRMGVGIDEDRTLVTIPCAGLEIFEFPCPALRVDVVRPDRAHVYPAAVIHQARQKRRR